MLPLTSSHLLSSKIGHTVRGLAHVRNMKRNEKYEISEK